MNSQTEAQTKWLCEQIKHLPKHNEERPEAVCVILTVDRRIAFLTAIVYSFLRQLICLRLYFDFQYVQKNLNIFCDYDKDIAKHWDEIIE